MDVPDCAVCKTAGPEYHKGMPSLSQILTEHDAALVLDSQKTKHRGRDIHVSSRHGARAGLLRVRQPDKERDVLPDLHSPVLVSLRKSEEVRKLGRISKKALMIAI